MGKYSQNGVFIYVYKLAALSYFALNFPAVSLTKSTLVKILMPPLTLILLELKVISLYHQYKARPDCTSMQSDQALYTVGMATTNSHFDKDSSKNGRWSVKPI